MDGATMVTDNLVLGTMSINQILVVFNCSRESLSLRYWNTSTCTILTVLQPVKDLLLIMQKKKKDHKIIFFKTCWNRHVCYLIYMRILITFEFIYYVPLAIQVQLPSQKSIGHCACWFFILSVGVRLCPHSGTLRWRFSLFLGGELLRTAGHREQGQSGVTFQSCDKRWTVSN